MSFPSRRWICAAGMVAACATSTTGGETLGTASASGVGIAHRRRRGRGPTIVFESGLGNGLEVWDGVFAALDPTLAAFAYSRPGYGGSGALANDARTSEEAAALLRAVRAAADVSPPYLLVGHSLGGLYIAKYAASYPGEVVGLVFVDGRPPNFRALCAAMTWIFVRRPRQCRTAGPPTFAPRAKASQRVRTWRRQEIC